MRPLLALTMMRPTQRAGAQAVHPALGKTWRHSSTRRKGDNMKSRILISISAITLLPSLAIPLRLGAQDNRDCKRQDRYLRRSGRRHRYPRYSHQPGGCVTGPYIDANNVFHGYLRAPDCTFTTFDAPDAGNGLTRAPTPSASTRQGRSRDTPLTRAM